MTMPFSFRWREPSGAGGIVDGIARTGMEVLISLGFSDRGRERRGIVEGIIELGDGEIASGGFEESWARVGDP